MAAVVGAAGGSLWARRVIAENLAHSSYVNAVSRLGHDIASARADGLPVAGLRPYSQGLAAASARPVPSDKTFWSGSTEAFYNRQSRNLDALDSALRTELHGATTAAKGDDTLILSSFGKDLVRARRDGLTAARYAHAYRDATQVFAGFDHLAQYQAQLRVISPDVKGLSKLIGYREKDLKGIKAVVMKSSRRLVAVRALITRRLAAAGKNLSILTIFHGAKSLRAWLDQVARWALGRPRVRGAILGASDIGSVMAALHRKMRKFVPSKWILVSTQNETVSWYQGATEIGSSLATTGNPLLPTVKGHFSIIAKFSPFTFRSPEPPGSPYYYPPSPTTFAMEFQSAGYFLHDAPWRSVFGPGSNGPGIPGTNYGGSHGCVNLPYDAAAFLFAWAPMGTPVVVV